MCNHGLKNLCIAISLKLNIGLRFVKHNNIEQSLQFNTFLKLTHTQILRIRYRCVFVAVMIGRKAGIPLLGFGVPGLPPM